VANVQILLCAVLCAEHNKTVVLFCFIPCVIHVQSKSNQYIITLVRISKMSYIHLLEEVVVLGVTLRLTLAHQPAAAKRKPRLVSDELCYLQPLSYTTQLLHSAGEELTPGFKTSLT